MLPSDLDEVSRLGVASKASWGYDIEWMRIFAGELTLSRQAFVRFIDAQVVCLGGQIVGYFTIRRLAQDIAELEHLFVRADCFRKRIGTQLLQAALASAAKLGVKTLRLNADPYAAGFYERFGAARVGDHQSNIAGRMIPIYEFTIVNE